MHRVSSFRQLIAQAADHHGDSLFLIDDEFIGPLTYTQIAKFAEGLERTFDELGIPSGAAVATIFHNCGLAAALFLAVIASRRVLVPLNPASTQDELTYMLDRAECAAVLFDPSHCRSHGMGDRQAIQIADHRA